jgi:hypothetical protein
VNSEPLHATKVVKKMVWTYDSIGTKLHHFVSFVVADNAHHDLILIMA